MLVHFERFPSLSKLYRRWFPYVIALPAVNASATGRNLASFYYLINLNGGMGIFFFLTSVVFE